MAKRRQIAKSAAAAATDVAKTTHLIDIQPVSVDAVDAAANKRRFVVIKEEAPPAEPPPATPPIETPVHEDVAALSKALGMEEGDARNAALLTVAKAIGTRAGVTLLNEADVKKSSVEAAATAARASVASYMKAVDNVVTAMAAAPAPVVKSKSPEEVSIMDALDRLLARVDDIGKSFATAIEKMQAGFVPVAAKLESVEKRVSMLGVPSSRPSVGSSAALSIEDDAAPASSGATVTWPSDMAADDIDD